MFNVEKNEITLINKKKKIMKKCEMKMIKKSFNFKIIKTKLKSKFKLKHHHKTVLSDEKKNFKKKTHFKKHQINNFSRNLPAGVCASGFGAPLIGESMPAQPIAAFPVHK